MLGTTLQKELKPPVLRQSVAVHQANSDALPSHIIRRLKPLVKALEQERQKMEKFKTELPLCMQLVDHALETTREQVAERGPLEDDGSSDVKSDDKHLEKCELPCTRLTLGLKPAAAVHEYCNSKLTFTEEERLESNSAQRRGLEIINQSSSSGSSSIYGGQQNRGTITAPLINVDSSLPEQPALPRKPRRRWSSALHQRFLRALKLLGGPSLATPHHIRELMDVEGLTNEEVKSHLQKFRMHARQRMAAATQEANIKQAQQYRSNFALQHLVYGDL